MKNDQNEQQVAFSHPLANRTDGNHIFLNFVPCISIDPVKIGGDIKAIVFKYATRLLKLQVLRDSTYLTEKHL